MNINTTLACLGAIGIIATVHAEELQDLTKPDSAGDRTSVTINGKVAKMTYPAKNAFDNDLKTFVCAQVGPSAARPFELNYVFDDPVVVNCYRMHAYSTAGNGGYPKAWLFEGSNDGTAWTKLDERQGQSFSKGKWLDYSCENNTAFKHYRLKIVEGLSAKRFDLGEVELCFAGASPKTEETKEDAATNPKETTTGGGETFADLTKPGDSATRAFATVNGAAVKMTYPAQNVFDDDLKTFACAQKPPSEAAPFEIGYDFGEAVKVNCYRMHPFSSAGNAGFPKSWIFEGSNDGTAWTKLDERKGQVLAKGKWYTYICGNAAAYSRYRVKVTEGYSPKRFDFGEMELGFVSDGEAAPATAKEPAKFRDLTKPDEAAKRTVATINGAKVSMSGKGNGSDGSKYPPENIFDDDLKTFTCAQKGPTPAAPIELNYDFGEAVKVNCYRLYGYSTAGNGGYPKTWTFEGSNDGASWTKLDERKGEKLTKEAWHTYRFGNDAAYRHYRLKVTEGLSPKRFDLGEMEIGFEPGNAIASAQEGKTFRLASYNIHHGEAKGSKYDVRRSLDVVEWETQDFIGMNEVDWKSKRVEGADTPADIASITGRHVEYGKAKPYGGGFYGNAVVSKEEPISVEMIDLPRGNGQNGLKCVLVLCEFADLWFGSMHLDLRENLENQLKSVEIVRGIVAEKSKTKPVFLCGDWNNEPDSEPLVKLGEFMTVISDIYSPTYNGFQPRECAPTDEVCIDYIAVDSAHASKVAVTAQTVKYDFTSDHNPIMVTLVFI